MCDKDLRVSNITQYVLIKKNNNTKWFESCTVLSERCTIRKMSFSSKYNEQNM